MNGAKRMKQQHSELKDLDDAISNLKVLTRSVSVRRYDKVHLGLIQTIIRKSIKGLSKKTSFYTLGLEV